MRLRPALLMACMIAAGPAAFGASAQGAKTDIAGDWKLLTSTFDGGECTMDGSISLKPSATPNAYTCGLMVETHCKQDGKVYEYWRVRQSCTATRKGADVRITTKIDKVESATFFGKEMTAAQKSNYVPDNFEVTISPSGAEMKGKLVDAVRILNSRFWRDVDLIG